MDVAFLLMRKEKLQITLTSEQKRLIRNIIRLATFWSSVLPLMDTTILLVNPLQRVFLNPSVLHMRDINKLKKSKQIFSFNTMKRS
jgi:hypothetical protein